MPGYELKDAKFLLSFYEGKLIGQKFNPALKHTILMLGMEGDNEYELYAYAKNGSESKVEKRLVAEIARDLALPAPEQVLKDKKEPGLD